MRLQILVPVLGSASMLAAGELPPKIVAKFVQIIGNSANAGGKVACRDSSVQAELAPLGYTHDGASRVAWAASEAEVRSLKGAGKLVICGRLEWLASGGSIAVVEEGGKPQIYLHMGNIATSGVALGEGILKIGKRSS